MEGDYERGEGWAVAGYQKEFVIPQFATINYYCY